MIWHDMLWSVMNVYDMLCYALMWKTYYDTIWHNLICMYTMTLYDMICYVVIWHDITWPGMKWYGMPCHASPLYGHAMTCNDMQTNWRNGSGIDKNQHNLVKTARNFDASPAVTTGMRQDPYFHPFRGRNGKFCAWAWGRGPLVPEDYWIPHSSYQL